MSKFKDLPSKPCNDGIQYLAFYPNGYGASVVKHEHSYGGDVGLYELAVLGKDGRITYDTPITNDVLGYLTEDSVDEILEQIRNLIKITKV